MGSCAGGAQAKRWTSAIVVDHRRELSGLVRIEIGRKQVADALTLRSRNRVSLLTTYADFGRPHRTRRKIRSPDLHLLRVVDVNAHAACGIADPDDKLHHCGPLRPQRHNAAAD